MGDFTYLWEYECCTFYFYCYFYFSLGYGSIFFFGNSLGVWEFLRISSILSIKACLFMLSCLLSCSSCVFVGLIDFYDFGASDGSLCKFFPTKTSFLSYKLGLSRLPSCICALQNTWYNPANAGDNFFVKLNTYSILERVSKHCSEAFWTKEFSSFSFCSKS